MGKVSGGLLDSAVDKLWSIVQRTNVEDFVGLYLLLNSSEERIDVWNVVEGAEQKFGFELDPVLIAASFMKVEEFDFLPKMLVPLNVSELQSYFKQKAREVSTKFLT